MSAGSSACSRSGTARSGPLTPRLREAINATGIILHTGLGRAVFPGSVVDSMLAEIEGLLDVGGGPRERRAH